MKLTLGLCLAFLTACVSQTAVLQNQEGKLITCKNSGWGWLGAPIAMSSQKECIKKAKAAGYSDITPPAPPPPPVKPTKPAVEKPF